MHWIALLPPEHERLAWGWHALQFTPRVAWVDEALLLEISGSRRLWGGPRALLRRLLTAHPFDATARHAQGATSLVALALLRLRVQGAALPAERLAQFPLAVLSAALPHVGTLARMGCNTWGGVRALPRAGVARRFGAQLLDALDAAWGERPEQYPWLALPEVFDVKLELPALATTTPELMWSAARLLTQLQVWLQARQRGVLALELEWTLDLKRLDGVDLPRQQQLVLRTAQATQDLAHLRRLMGEHLARATLAAPANQLRLRSLETEPWAGASKSLLMQELVQGDRLHELIERLSVRLSANNVVVAQALADHRPERMQRWRAAVRVPLGTGAAAHKPLASAQQAVNAFPVHPLYPTWLLAQPLRLEVRNGQPHYYGPLRLLSRAQRVEAGWWEVDAGVAAEGSRYSGAANSAPAETATQSSRKPSHKPSHKPSGLALRDYFLARNSERGLLWIYRERLRPMDSAQGDAAPVNSEVTPANARPSTTKARAIDASAPRWFLHGIYA